MALQQRTARNALTLLHLAALLLQALAAPTEVVARIRHGLGEALLLLLVESHNNDDMLNWLHCCV